MLFGYFISILLWSIVSSGNLQSDLFESKNILSASEGFSCELCVLKSADADPVQQLVYLHKTKLKVECPGVITKKGWDGLRPLHVNYLPRPVDLVIIQHTVTPTCSTFETCKDIVQSIQNNQMDNLGYWDIGISFLVGGDGKIYEGAGWLHVGAHTYGYNAKSIAISFIGNFNNDEPTPKALSAAQALLDCGVKEGHLTSNYKLVGHRQLVALESPGRKLYREIRTWPHYLDDATSIKN